VRVFLNWVDTGYGERRPKKPVKPKTAREPVAAKPVQARPATKPAAKSRPAPRRLPVAVSVSEELEDGVGASCSRSPCGPLKDPKAEEREILAALACVGTDKLRQRVEVKTRDTGRKDPKTGEAIVERYVVRTSTHEVSRPGVKKGWPLTVACGLGVDSVAILVGLVQEHRRNPHGGFRPEAISFADTGGEHPETYQYLKVLNRYLAQHGFPLVTVVAWSTEMLPASAKDKAGWGTGITLEISALNSHGLPSIATGGHDCSDKFKIQPQSTWLRREFAEQLGDGLEVVRAIGYDATEESRLIKGGTYSSATEQKNKGFSGWWPLVEWGWDRSRCIAEIAAAFGSKRQPRWDLVPRKSACFFCSAAKVEEIVLLWESGHVDLLERALFMEQVAFYGRFARKSERHGLGRSFAWVDFVTARLDRLGPRQRVVITGGILVPEVDRNGKTSWNAIYEGHPEGFSGVVRPEWRVYFPDRRFPLVSPKRVEAIKALALEWIAASPKVKGELAADLTFGRLADKIPAFEILGFRGTNVAAFDRLHDEILPYYEKKAEEGDPRYERSVGGLVHVYDRLLRKRWKPKARRNPGAVTVGISLAGGLAVGGLAVE